jgi:hypothetical protein
MHSVRSAGFHASARREANMNLKVRHGKVTVVARHDLARALNPARQHALQVGRARFVEKDF